MDPSGVLLKHRSTRCHQQSLLIFFNHIIPLCLIALQWVYTPPGGVCSLPLISTDVITLWKVNNPVIALWITTTWSTHRNTFSSVLAPSPDASVCGGCSNSSEMCTLQKRLKRGVFFFFFFLVFHLASIPLT